MLLKRLSLLLKMTGQREPTGGVIVFLVTFPLVLMTTVMFASHIHVSNIAFTPGL